MLSSFILEKNERGMMPMKQEMKFLKVVVILLILLLVILIFKI